MKLAMRVVEDMNEVPERLHFHVSRFRTNMIPWIGTSIAASVSSRRGAKLEHPVSETTQDSSSVSVFA